MSSPPNKKLKTKGAEATTTAATTAATTATTTATTAAVPSSTPSTPSSTSLPVPMSNESSLVTNDQQLGLQKYTDKLRIKLFNTYLFKRIDLDWANTSSSAKGSVGGGLRDEFF